jgi:signal recognition particle subunit SRP54
MKVRKFTLEDFRMHFQTIQKHGNKDMIGRMPGMAELIPEGEDPGVALRAVSRMIDAMTAEERADPNLIDTRRRVQIAEAASVRPQEVGKFLEQFAVVQALMDQMMSMSVWQRISMVLGFRRVRPPDNPPPA